MLPRHETLAGEWRLRTRKLCCAGLPMRRRGLEPPPGYPGPGLNLDHLVDVEDGRLEHLLACERVGSGQSRLLVARPVAPGCGSPQLRRRVGHVGGRPGVGCAGLRVPRVAAAVGSIGDVPPAPDHLSGLSIGRAPSANTQEAFALTTTPSTRSASITWCCAGRVPRAAAGASDAATGRAERRTARAPAARRGMCRPPPAGPLRGSASSGRRMPHWRRATRIAAWWRRR
jgi:hypothetical protein